MVLQQRGLLYIIVIPRHKVKVELSSDFWELCDIDNRNIEDYLDNIMLENR